MRIRKLTLDDYEKVYDLWLSCEGMGLNSPDDSRDGMDKFLKRNPDTCFAAEDGQSIVGVIMAGSDGRRGYIYHTAVAPNCRNRGIGTELVNTVLASLQRMGINKAALVVFDRNKGGNEFWERQGFTVRNDLVYRNKALAEMTRIDT